MDKKLLIVMEIKDIRTLRKKYGLTQKELAVKSGVSQSLIAKIESGRIDPAYSKVMVIIDVLKQLEEKKSIKLKDVMNKKLMLIHRKDKVSKAVKLMKHHKISQLPVFDKNVCVGSISEKTILERVTSGEDLRGLSRKNVESIMEEAFPQVDENTPISVISELLARRYAILITKRGKTIGIVTKADLLKVI